MTFTELYKNKITPEFVKEVSKDEIFVFESNKSGIHGAGAAKYAREQFGAGYGIGIGMTGQCYAIPTKGKKLQVLGLDEIKSHVDRFIMGAKHMTDKTFYVTKIGCGLAGYTVDDIAPLFENVLHLPNVKLPIEFLTILLYNEMERLQNNLNYIVGNYSISDPEQY